MLASNFTTYQPVRSFLVVGKRSAEHFLTLLVHKNVCERLKNFVACRTAIGKTQSTFYFDLNAAVGHYRLKELIPITFSTLRNK